MAGSGDPGDHDTSSISWVVSPFRTIYKGMKKLFTGPREVGQTSRIVKFHRWNYKIWLKREDF
jgi:hypothetical protein